MADSYVWFGAGVAPSYLLIGIPLGHALKDLGIWGRLVAGLTILGAIATGISYPAKRFDEPWNTLWGIEGPVWLAVIAAGLVAGGVALRRERSLRAWLVMVIPFVIVVSTLLLGGYYPHATPVGYGIFTAFLTRSTRTLEGKTTAT